MVFVQWLTDWLLVLDRVGSGLDKKWKCHSPVQWCGGGVLAAPLRPAPRRGRATVAVPSRHIVTNKISETIIKLELYAKKYEHYEFCSRKMFFDACLNLLRRLVHFSYISHVLKNMFKTISTWRCIDLQPHPTPIITPTCAHHWSRPVWHLWWWIHRCL